MVLPGSNLAKKCGGSLRQTERAEVSLRSAAFRGSFWVVSAYAAGQALRLGNNLILARWLVPADFGLMTLVNVFLQGLQMFSDVGIGPSIIQNKRGDDPAFLDTAWTVQVIRGAALWGGSCLLAVPLGAFYGEPMLWKLLPVAGVTALISGFNSTRLLNCNRDLKFGWISTVDLLAQALSIMTMISWAFIRPSIWALVAGGIAASILKMILTHTIVPGKANRFHWDCDAASALFRFGKWIFISTVITFLASQADRIILGKLVPLEVLGVYSIAFAIAMLPAQIGSQICNAVLFPLFAKEVRSNASALGSKVIRARRIILRACLLLTVGTTLVANPFFNIFYDQRYDSGGWMVQMLSIPVWFSILQTSTGQSLLALGDSRAFMLCNAGRFLASTLACIGGYWLFGIEGFIVGMGIGAMCGQVGVQMAMSLHGIHIMGQDAKYSLAFAIFVWACPCLSTMISTKAHSIGDIESLVVLGGVLLLPLVAGIAWGLAHFLTCGKHESLGESTSFLRKIAARIL